MQAALAQSELAAASGEVPIGAVVVQGDRIIGLGHNAPISLSDPCAHAEIIALRAASQHLGNYRLDDCELYVTLEPCVMCAGAIAHARIRRLIYGAPEPKTGAVGSVLNVLADTRLSHHTQVTSGVLPEVCAQKVQDFFIARRARAKEKHEPLREDALRVPLSDFACTQSAYPWQPRTLQALPSLQGLRLHYVYEGPCDAKRTVLLVHGQPTWGYWFRHWIAPLIAAGVRVLVPDCIGYGKSDKPKKNDTVDALQHARILQELLQHHDCQEVFIVGQGWSIPLVKQLMQDERRIAQGLLLLSPPHKLQKNSTHQISDLLRADNPYMSDEVLSAYRAPFPNKGHCAALQSENADTLPQAIVRVSTPCVEQVWQGLREPQVQDLPLLWKLLHNP